MDKWLALGGGLMGGMITCAAWLAVVDHQLKRASRNRRS